ncbi:hypothetical protein GCK32_011843 [Trichostrongylus colubriformis]|uniref:Uncharacterized protein n=1 Tax=Trichostrongylus colubriformis TaxID=6319 RepID=A0AAN8FL30_TRICO
MLCPFHPTARPLWHEPSSFTLSLLILSIMLQLRAVRTLWRALLLSKHCRVYVLSRRGYSICRYAVFSVFSLRLPSMKNFLVKVIWSRKQYGWSRHRSNQL